MVRDDVDDTRIYAWASGERRQALSAHVRLSIEIDKPEPARDGRTHETE
jgi:hypothetical protein